MCGRYGGFFLNIFLPLHLFISKTYWSTVKCFSIMGWSLWNRSAFIYATQGCTHQNLELGPWPCLKFSGSCLLFSQGPGVVETVWQDNVFCLGQTPLRELIFCSSKFLCSEPLAFLKPLLIRAHDISWRNE